MPWTRRQVRYLESSGSPLTQAQKDKMNAELHENPALGHAKKGSSQMAKSHKIREMRVEVHRGKDGKVTGHTVHHHHMPTKASKSGAFMSEEHVSYPFGADGHSSTHGHMLDHIGEHLQIGSGGSAEEEPENSPSAAEEEAEGE